MTVIEDKDSWQRSDAQIFWGEIAPCDHVVQIYENDQVFVDLLGGFTCGGIRNGDSVVVIATAQHIAQLNDQLRANGFDPFSLSLKDQFIALDAEETLARFMVNGWPDENLFRHTVSELLTRAKRHNRQVRAFGEMVAILWAQGLKEATVYLEHLWNKFCESEDFCLFCAYPRHGFAADPHSSIMHICGTHSKIVAGVGIETNEILYKTSSSKAS